MFLLAEHLHSDTPVHLLAQRITNRQLEAWMYRLAQQYGTGKPKPKGDGFLRMRTKEDMDQFNKAMREGFKV